MEKTWREGEIMRLAVYSDVHNNDLKYPERKPDFVLLLGDIHWRDVKKINEHFTKNYDSKIPCIGVIGNHDVLDTFKNTTVVDIHKRVIEIEGVKFGGFGGCPRYNNKQNSGQFEEWEAQKFIKGMEKVDIFLAHSNPAYERSENIDSTHRGFASFKQLLDREKTSYFFHGHIHENYEHKYKKIKVFSTYGLKEYEIK